MQKMAARTVAGLLSILFIVVSCASNSPLVIERMYPGPPLPDDKKAILLEGTSLYERNMAVTTVYVKIISVDGKEVKKNKLWIEVLPGMHTVECVWVFPSGYLDKNIRHRAGIGKASLEAKANRKYRFDVEIFEGEVIDNEVIDKWRIDVKELGKDYP